MPFVGTQVTRSVESAVSTSLTRTVYVIIVQNTDTDILLLTCACLYMNLQ